MIHNVFLIVDTIGTALEDAITNNEDNTNDSTDR